MTALQLCYPTRVLLHEYEQLREIELSPEGQRALREACDLLELHLEQSGIGSIDLSLDAPASALGGVASVERTGELLTAFERALEPTMTDASPRYARVAASVARDFARWLRVRAPTRGAVP